MVYVAGDQVLLRSHVLYGTRQPPSDINLEDRAVPRKASKIAGSLLALPKTSNAVLTSWAAAAKGSDLIQRALYAWKRVDRGYRTAHFWTRIVDIDRI